jgi:hypothetical protein
LARYSLPLITCLIRVLAPLITAAAHPTVIGIAPHAHPGHGRLWSSRAGDRSIAGERGHQLATPSSSQLDLFDVAQLREAVHDIHAVLHLTTRIPSPNRRNLPGAWDVNDRLRADATRSSLTARCPQRPTHRGADGRIRLPAWPSR